MRLPVPRLALLAAVALVALPAAPAAAQTPVQDGAPICGLEAAPGGAAAVPDDGVLRIATYNVLHSQDDYPNETLTRRIDLIADALAGSAADAVGVQELVRSTNHGMVARRLAAALGARTGHAWSWCWYQSNPHLPGEADTAPGGAGGPVSQAIAERARSGDGPWAEGLGIVSRGAITAAASHRLVSRAFEAPACQAAQPGNPLATPTCFFDTRQVLWARVATACGDLDLFTSHLAHDQSAITEQVRLVQITDALAQINQRATAGATPDVFVGDFNTLEGSSVWQAVVSAGFVDSFRVAEPGDPGATSDQALDAAGPTATQRIDYVFARPGSSRLAPADGDVIGDSPAPFAGSGGQSVVWPSDHLGVAVTLLNEAACRTRTAPVSTTAGATTPPVGSSAATAGPTGSELPATGGGASPAPLLLAALFAFEVRSRLRVPLRRRLAASSYPP